MLSFSLVGLITKGKNSVESVGINGVAKIVSRIIWLENLTSRRIYRFSLVTINNLLLWLFYDLIYLMSRLLPLFHISIYSFVVQNYRKFFFFI